MTSARTDSPLAAAEPQEMSLLGFANLVLRHRMVMVMLPVLTALLAVALSVLTQSARYRTESTFKVESAGAAENSMATLASRFGVGDFATTGESLDFYLFLLESRQVLARVAASQVEMRPGNVEVTQSAVLMEVMPIDADDPAERMKAAVEILRSRIDASVNSSAGLIHVAVRGESPDLAVAVHKSLLHEVLKFNVERRQSQGRAERQFVEGQVVQARSDLRAAERRLEEFLEENRSWQNSPQLSFENARLVREVEMRSSLYGSLALAYEQARIEEVRSTPAITVIEPPVAVAFIGVSTWARAAVVGFGLGLALALTIVLSREFVRRQWVLHPEEAAEFATLRRDSGRVMPKALRSLMAGRRRFRRRSTQPEPGA